jgi:hypothetical protein
MHDNNLSIAYNKYGFQDEDNEELYCRTCDQWFSSLHNKKEHLYGRQHLQVNLIKIIIILRDYVILFYLENYSTSFVEILIFGRFVKVLF